MSYPYHYRGSYLHDRRRILSSVVLLALMSALTGCETVRRHEVIPAAGKGEDFTPPRKLTDAELDYIVKRRAVVGLPAPGRASPVVGLTASGGGLRSSIITVGAFQGMQGVRLGCDGVTALERMDYLSAVSGGSYTSAWLVSHCLPNPAYTLHSKFFRGPFAYGALSEGVGAVGADGNPAPEAAGLRAELGMHPKSGCAPSGASEWRVAYRAMGFDDRGFCNSSSYLGDLLEECDDSCPTRDMNGHPFMRLRSQAPANGVTNWSNAPYVCGWAARYPVHFATTWLLNWTPTDKMNEHRLTAMFARLLRNDYLIPDASRVVCVPRRDDNARDLELLFRKLPPKTGGREIALADINPDGSEAPYLIIGTCLINTAGELDSTESPPSGHFEFTSRWVGGERTGYVATQGFGRYVVSRDGNVLTTSDSPELFNLIPLGDSSTFPLSQALAASAAASDGAAMPDVGTLGSYFLNTDLRHTDRNFNQFAASGWYGGTAAKFANFMRETTVERFDACKNATSGSLYFIDGGFFENTGAFALLRRGVPLIAVIDGTFDIDYDWDDFHQFVCITHRLGYRWIFDGEEGARLRHALMRAASDPLDDTPRELPLSYVPERLVYRMRLVPPAGSGRAPTTLLVSKMSYEGLAACPHVTPDRRRMLADYKKFDPNFPHKPSGEITTDAHEWECLRLVGKYMGMELGRAVDAELRHPERPIACVVRPPFMPGEAPLVGR